MAIVWALRADNAQFAARYSTQSTAAQQMGGGVISYDVDATAINGHNFNLDQGSVATRILQYPFRGCLTTKAMSVLARVKIGAVNSSAGFWGIVNAGDLAINTMKLYQSSSLYSMAAFNESGGTVKSGSLGVAPAGTAAWYDVVITWDGTTSANKLQLWVDGTATQLTAGAAYATTTFHDILLIGGFNTGVAGARFLIEEMVVWNTEIDPTSVTLDSGTGSLNGAARTSLVAVNALNGGTNTGAGAANILSTASEVIAGVTTNGTYVGPANTNVKTGVSFGVADTGTYDGSDRWTDPGAANVRSGTAYKANSTSNNQTGSAAIPVAGNVRLGTATDATTGTVVIPTTAQVKTGVAFDTASTGTYTGSDRWTDPGTTNVKKGVTYKADSTSSNRTGTLDGYGDDTPPHIGHGHIG